MQKHRGFKMTWTLWKLKEIQYFREKVLKRPVVDGVTGQVGRNWIIPL